MKKHLMIGLIIFVSIFCLVSCDNHEHDITEVRVDPTCTEEGAVYSTCECGYSNTLVIPALGHHFENGVWIYKDEIINQMKEDFEITKEKSELMNDKKIKNNLFKKVLRSIVRIFSPLL